MSDWSAGYVVDVDYTHGFYQELTPSHLNFCALLQGVQAPDLDQSSLTYCELGCGQGFSTNLLAAANPSIEFYATDFNPAHIAGARALARSARSANVHFFDDSFADFIHRKDLPDFDYITLHGIYSWISPENRKAIVNFIRLKLKPGGMVYISYNAMPGWASMMPLRRLMLEHASAQGTSASLHSRISASLDFATRLQGLDTRFFASHPKLASRIEKLKRQDRNYVAHEYFNQDLTPFYFMDVAQELSEAKLSFAGSAAVIDTIEKLNLSEEQAKFLAEIDNMALRQTVRDHMIDQQFRRDIFVKGPVRLSPVTARSKWDETRFVAMQQNQDVTRELQGMRFTAKLEEAVYKPLIEALEQGPLSISELMKQPALSKINPSRLIQAITFLAAKGSVRPCLSQQGLAERRFRTDLFNKAITEQALYDGRYSNLASPVTGGGIGAERTAQLIFLAPTRKEKDAPRFVRNALHQTGHRLVKEGKTLTDEAETLAEYSKRIEAFDEKTSPLWKTLGIDDFTASAKAPDARKRTA
ncbi:class I SAM-dependent methyltransferase [Microvirga sp. P5_D2]